MIKQWCGQPHCCFIYSSFFFTKMHYQTNRVNHDFQIAYFIAGSCHTPDAAYAILCDLKEDRSNAIKTFEASKLRERAKILRAQRLMQSSDEADRLEGQADIDEIEAMAETVNKNLAAAKAELATIEACMEKLEPLRQYAHLSLPEAHEAAQAEEWKLELIFRAQNSIFTIGSIQPDQFATMRMHPAFKDEILPAIEHFTSLVRNNKVSEVVALLSAAPRYELPKLPSLQHKAMSQLTA